MLRWDLAEAESEVVRYLKEEAPPVRLHTFVFRLKVNSCPFVFYSLLIRHFSIVYCKHGQSSECR